MAVNTVARDEGAQFVQIEQGVLGALVLDAAHVAAETFSRVRTEDFADGTCRHLFETAQRMYANGDVIDALTLCNAAGGDEYRKYIMQLMEVTPTAAHYEEYIAILLDQSKRRAAAQIGMKLYELGLMGADIGELQAQAEALAEVLTRRNGARSVDMQQLMLGFFSGLGEKRSYLDWGYDKINTHLFSEAGDYIIIGARPSVGKTAFALNLSARIAKEHRVTFFSLETDKRKITDRLMTAASGALFEHIKRGEVNDEEMAALAYAKSKMLKLDFHFVAASGMTVEDIRAETLRNKSDVIIIDYLGLIDHRDKKLTEYAMTTAVSKGLQRLAHGTGTYVIALSQLNRAGSGMEALRGSGQIEQDADVIMLLEHINETEDEPTAEARADRDNRRVLRITKNKEGICGKIRMWFDGKVQRFTEEWDDFYTTKPEPMEAKKPNEPKQSNKSEVQQHLDC